MILLTEAFDIRDIKPPVYFPGEYLFLMVIGIVIVLAGLVFLVIFLRKRLKKTKAPNLTPKPAQQRALEALQALKAQDLPGQGRTKEYYFQLSDITRHYIENRFSIRAPEMTTEEFLFSLRDSSTLSAAQKNLLKEFLSLCDIVKFAKYGPSQKEIDESFNAAVKLVDETKNDI